MRIKMYSKFTIDNINEEFSQISQKVLISEINDLLVDLTDLKFDWYFPNYDIGKKFIIVSIYKKYERDFKIDDTMIDCIPTLVDWMIEKYSIVSFSYVLSLCSGSDITTKEFGEEEFGLAVNEIRIILNL